MGDDWVGGFFRIDAATCFLFSAKRDSKLLLTLLDLEEGEGFDDKEDLEDEEGELLRVSSFFGPFLL